MHMYKTSSCQSPHHSFPSHPSLSVHGSHLQRRNLARHDHAIEGDYSRASLFSTCCVEKEQNLSLIATTSYVPS